MSAVTHTARSVALPMAALSAALHAAAFLALARVRPAPAHESISIEIVRRAPAAKPVKRAEVPKPRAPPPEAPAAAATRPAPAPASAAAPPPALPASSPPPQGAPRALPKVGISLGSTVASGGFAVGVGNTAYGRAEEKAADPASVRRYTGGVPASRLSAQPRPVELPKIEYPADARRAGVEGKVVLLLRLDAKGAVAGVQVVDAPSPALAAAAKEGARRFRFTPALVEGEPVETEIRFTYTFLLE
ncbi:MAG: energy transducer TonB [Anaeromyxobacteraceae bacterium]